MYKTIATVLATLVLCIGGFAVYQTRTGSVPEPAEIRASLPRARVAFESGRFQEALDQCEVLLSDRPDSSSVLMLAGESATKLKRFDAALDLYSRIPDTAGSDAAVARWASGEILFHLGRVTPAIEQLRRSVQLNPSSYDAQFRLSYLLNATGQRWETKPHLKAMLQAGQVTVELLLLVGNLGQEFDASGELDRFLAADPSDPMTQLGLASRKYFAGEFAECVRLTTKIVAEQPRLLAAHALLGNALDKSEPTRLPAWNNALPAKADAHPTIWYLRGRMLRDEQPREAVRCFAEAILLDPNDVSSHLAIAAQLNQLGDESAAKRFADRASKLQRLHIALAQLYSSNTQVNLVEEAATLCFELERMWEAASWMAYGQSLSPSAEWPRALAQRIQGRYPLKPGSPLTLATANLARERDWWLQYPLPAVHFPQPLNDPQRQPGLQAAAASQVHFANVASELGIAFGFNNNGSGAGGVGRKIFEMTGGGVGVLDYDLNGLPDIFFTQGGQVDRSQVARELRLGEFTASSSRTNSITEPQQVSPADGKVMTDRLFRSRYDNYPNPGDPPSGHALPQFADATRDARLDDSRFGQGVACGDVNCDGFDDLYVANLGANQLWLNNGDGTFWNATHTLPTEEHAWTCSAAIVDLNGDGLPEIYDANYVIGDDILDRLCPVGGQPRGCSPLVFRAATDRVLVANPDGTWRSNQATQMAELAANSFGLAVFRMDDEPLPRVFVSVDQQANRFFKVELLYAADRNNNSEQATGFQLIDEALISGLAYDEAGQAQACMGIAAGDADQDGDVDLYVTNFYLEYNTLYLQRSGLFRDSTPRSGTLVPTRPMLAFGTQFLDMQLDGFDDLLVLNGHIDDHTHIGVAELMPAQVFVGVGKGGFVVSESSDCGAFFEQPRLGRALATVDLDQDGLVDAICGDLEAPVEVLHNRSQRAGEFVTVQLIGTESDRNAFCAIATLSIGDWQQKRQLIAGSGYQATNERQLHFSIPSQQVGGNAAEAKANLEIQWPSGRVDRWHAIALNRRYAAIESQQIVVLR